MAINKIVYGGNTLIDITDTTATAADVASGKYFYTNAGIKTAGTGTGGGGSVTQDANGYIVLPSTGGGGGGGATQHTIHLEFSDSTDTDVAVYYDDSLIGTMITAYEPSTWTYSSKTVTLAQLDGTTWYDKQSIPIGVELIDYTQVLADTMINQSGQEQAQQYFYASDYTPIESGMTFTYVGALWGYMAFYNSSKSFISSIYIYDDATTQSGAKGEGELSGAKIPNNAAYIRLSGLGNDNTGLSLIRTA